MNRIEICINFGREKERIMSPLCDTENRLEQKSIDKNQSIDLKQKRSSNKSDQEIYLCFQKTK